jgi:streptomycin 6-kinase
MDEEDLHAAEARALYALECRPVKPPLLAATHEAEVFGWGAGRVLKLYRPGIARATAEREAANARAALAAGARTPRVLEVCIVEERHGVVFDRVDGPTMLEALVAQPEAAVRLAHALADLQADLHRRVASSLPPLRARLAERIRRAEPLDDGVRAAALAALDARPDGRALCHGDLHPANVLLAADGPVIIDWRDATSGDPAADLARSSLIIRHAEAPATVPAAVASALARLRDTLHAAWLDRYATHDADVPARVEGWIPAVAAARLAEPLGARERDVVRTLAGTHGSRGEAARVP